MIRLPPGRRRGSIGCGAHRSALLAYAEDGVAGPEVEDALAHLATCPGCRSTTEASLLLVAGLRRLGSAVRTASSSGDRNDRWPELRRVLLANGMPVNRPAPARRHSLGALGGSLVAPALVAVAVAWSGGIGDPGMTPPPDADPALSGQASPAAARTVGRPIYEPEPQTLVRAVLVAPDGPVVVPGAGHHSGAPRSAGEAPPAPVTAGVPI